MHASFSTRQILSAALLAAVAPRLAAAASNRQPDFNNDGYCDLVMAAPGEKIGTLKGAGAVNIVYGTADGLKSDNSQGFSQGSGGIGETAGANDHFGIQTAWGDFNNDGYSDLAVSATGEDSGAGSVNVIYGSASGLASANNQVFKQGVDGMQGLRTGSEYFGWALATGDFNGDGYDDLAVGASDEDVSGVQYAGAVHVIYGSGSGLTATGNEMWSQDTLGIQGEAEYIDYFGSALAAGDFNGDGKDDLAVGTPWENGNGKFNCGAVNVIMGSTSGLTSAGNQFWHQDSTGIANSINGYEYFGYALAAGDFDNDGKDDLAIGVDSETIDGKNNAGAMHVLYGGNNGLRATGSQFWTQNSSGVADACEANDRFGSTLGTGDFDGDGFMDLAVGAMDEAIDTKNGAGCVHILYGSANKLASASSQVWSQDTAGIAGAAAGGDSFGSLLIGADFDGDGKDDLAIGVPYEKVGAAENAGAINVIYGTGAKGLKSAGNQLWSQDSSGVGDKADKNDNLGHGAY